MKIQFKAPIQERCNEIKNLFYKGVLNKMQQKLKKISLMVKLYIHKQ